MGRFSKALGLTLVGAALLLGGCYGHAHHHRTVAVAPAPAAQVDVVATGATGGVVWVPGYWHWSGVTYLWVPGRYVTPRPGYVWVAPRYVYSGGSYVYFHGHWSPHRHYTVGSRHVYRRSPRYYRRTRVHRPPPSRGARRRRR